MNNELSIIVAGRPCTGKSTMLLQLEKLLKENGFSVVLSFENHPDYGGENSRYFHLHEEPHFDEKIAAVKANTKITLKEMQVAREFKPTKRIEIE